MKRLLFAVKHDIKYGIRYCFLLQFILFVFSFFSAYFMRIRIERINFKGNNISIPNIFDSYINFWGGVKLNIDSNSIEIPITWLTAITLITMICYIYPVYQLYGGAQAIILRYGDRDVWWGSKCIWCVIQAIVSLFVINCGFAISSVGNSGYYIHSDILSYMKNINAQDTNFCKEYIFSIYLYVIMIVLVQINLELRLGPIKSFIIVFLYNILSIYVNTPFFIGNFAMLYKNKVLIENGYNSYLGSALCILISVISILSGISYIKRKDILC